MLNLNASATAQEINAIAAMSNDARANLAARINATEPFTIFDNVEGKEGKEIICPFCGSGSHGNKNTGIKPSLVNGVWLYHCFAGNDCEGTLLNIIATANNLSTRGKDFFEVLAIAANITNQNFSLPADESLKKSTSEKKIMEPKIKQPEKFERLDEAQKNLPAFIKKQGGNWRGLSLDTLQRINCGFLPDVYFPEVKKKLPAVVIPNDFNGVYFRSIEGKFHKNNKPMATTTIYIPDATEFDLIITEGQINAASIFQTLKTVKDNPDFGIIACSGTSGEKLIIEKLQQLKDNEKKFRVILAFDNDTNNAGQNAADKILAALIKAGYTACTVDFIKTPDTDFNDILRQDDGEFKLFETIDNALAQVVFPDDSNENSDSDMHEVKSSDINGETDALEIEKNRVLSDAFNDSEIQKFFIPLPYVVTNHGVKKFGKKDISTICPRPILIKEKFFNLDDNTFKLSLEHLNANKQWKVIPPQPRGNIFNKNKIVELANFGLPVTTGNSAKIVDWIFNFDLANENYIPLTYTVNRCGWYNYNDNDYFIDPRRENSVLEEGKKINIIVDSASQTATALKTKGSLEKWREAYNLATDSTVARATVAASVAAPLLKVLGERNFVYYVHGKTRGGKSTALYLGASAVGNKDMVRVFDGTNNGLTAMAAETNDYPFFVDEKQAADTKLKNDFQRWIYSDANGTERARANKDGTAKPARTWQHITICNGETELLDDTATGGAHTRLLQIAAPDEILDADTCKKIRDIIKDNYGHAFPLFIDQLTKENFDELRERYEDFQKFFLSFTEDNGGKILLEYAKYIALIFIADQILNKAIGNDIDPIQWQQLLNIVPTIEDIDDAKREENIVSAFIASKAAHFEGSDIYNRDRGLDCYGKYKDGYLYIITVILNKFLTDEGQDAKKVVSDLIASGYFISDDKIEKGNKPRDTAVIRINGKLQRCYKVKADDDE